MQVSSLRDTESEFGDSARTTVYRTHSANDTHTGIYTAVQLYSTVLVEDIILLAPDTTWVQYTVDLCRVRYRKVISILCYKV